MGNEVDCACSKTGFYFDELINKYNLNVYEFPFCRSPFRIRNITAYRKLKKFIKNGSYDVIYCHEPVGGALGRLAGKANGKYTFYIAHGFHFFKGAGIKHWTLYYFFEWFLSFFTDTIVTICDEDYNHSLKLHAKNKYKIDGIGVDFKRFDLIDKELIRNNLRRQIGINNDDFLIISVGELSKRKNHIVILKALNKLNNPNIKLVLCGEGDEKRKLEKYCKRNDLEKNVLFLGFRKDVNEILTCGDLFIFPSLWEGLGLAGIEAMYSGLPIIASNRQGIKDYVIDGKTGFLFEPKIIPIYQH